MGTGNSSKLHSMRKLQAQPLWNRICIWWENLRLDIQFAIVSSIVVILGMLIIGSWVSSRIQTSVTQNSAASAALFVDSIIAPVLGELSNQSDLPPETVSKLDELINGTELGNQLLSVKVWRSDGKIIYSNRAELVNKIFPVTDSLENAFSGALVADFDDLQDEENKLERAENIPLLEIYSPVLDKTSGEVNAVMEFYSRAESLQMDLNASILGTWIVVGSITISMLAILSVIVRSGSKTIAAQSISLHNRVSELSQVRNKLEKSSREATRINEKYLKRLGSDLHDGPAQLIGLALLRLEDEGDELPKGGHTSCYSNSNSRSVRAVLSEALDDIRNISAGLVLPEVEELELYKALRLMAANHMQRTGSEVEFDCQGLPFNVDNSVKISLCRMVQESLTNSFLHSGRNDPVIRIRYSGHELSVAVSDDGIGFSNEEFSGEVKNIGLPGVRERIESIGGKFDVTAIPNSGTTVTAVFKIPE